MNSSLLPASTLNVASTHVQAALPSGSEPSGPKPSWAIEAGVGAGLVRHAVDPDLAVGVSVRLTAEIVWVIDGGHCRLAQPMTRCGMPETSLDGSPALPAASIARTIT